MDYLLSNLVYSIFQILFEHFLCFCFAHVHDSSLKIAKLSNFICEYFLSASIFQNFIVVIWKTLINIKLEIKLSKQTTWEIEETHV